MASAFFNNLLEERLNAAAVLGIDVAANADPDGHAAEQDGSGADDSNMTEAVARIVINSPAPISKKDLKAQLLAENFSQDRLGGYFYTIVMRLKRRRKIHVYPNGTMWKPT